MVVIPYRFNDKDALRKWLWKYLSDYHLTMVPRPCFARIPSFKATHVATARLAEEAAWQTAQAVLIAPDDVTEEARIMALRAGKRVYVPIPKADSAYLLEKVAPADAQVAAMMKEIGRFARQVPLAEVRDATVVVTGAVSVDRFGNWLGQGETFGELAPALTRRSGLLPHATRICIVDDKQIFEDFRYLAAPDEAPMDRIITKTQNFSPKPLPATGGEPQLTPLR